MSAYPFTVNFGAEFYGRSGAPVTCRGSGPPPTVTMAGVPEEAAATAVQFVDESIGKTHWTAWRNGVYGEKLVGENDFGRSEFLFPCPPKGAAHEYTLTAFALARPMNLRAGASPSAFARAVHAAGVIAKTSTAMFASVPLDP